ncbi:MAG: hypothetical protein Q8941_08540 [Bacteroidota bacterium]|nr:hypothetical protein [Bacteroidota bacterium]
MYIFIIRWIVWRKIVTCFLLSFLVAMPFSILAQPPAFVVAREQLEEEQYSFLGYVNKTSMDPGVTDRLSRFIVPEADSIHRHIMKDGELPDDEKVKATESLVYFMKELNQAISLKKIDVYDIPGVLESYKQVLSALLYHKPYADRLVSLSPGRSRLLAAAFWQYDECTLLEEITLYKLVVSSPGHIFHFLEWFPGFPLADSLLLVAAAHDPLKMASYLHKGKSGLQEIIRNEKNIYLQQVLAISDDPDVATLLPFIVPLAEKRITAGDILEKRMDITDYFQSMVNTLKEEIADTNHSSFIFQAPLRNAIKEKSFSFYVKQINELHNSPYNTRFAVIKDLRMEDIYYIITSCQEELYTSSYLGLYRRLMEYFRVQPADSLFRAVQYDNFREFMQMAANYNTLADFLSCMPREKAAELLNRFITGIESDTDSGLEKAMDIADSFTGLGAVPWINEWIENELQSNLDRCRSGQLYPGIRLYSILQQVYELVTQKDSVNKLWTYLGNHGKLEFKALQNKAGEIIEEVLFYGDKDGISSFRNFLNLFKDPHKWVISKNELWVTIRSVSGQPVIVYANLPLDNEKEMDLQAQDSLSAFLQQQSIVPVILVHRGHSYHLGHTLKRLQPSVKLVILGSCGSYSNILSVSDISPDAQIIVSKKAGSKFINDPMLGTINRALQNKKDLIWIKLWEELAIRFRKDEFVLNLFNEYIPPTKNASLFVLKLFNASRYVQ